MLKTTRISLVLGLCAAAPLTGCANVPRQSADLSAALNDQIADMQKAHIVLVNRYFDNVEDQMRQTIQTDYKDALVQTMKDKQKAKGTDLTLEQYDKIIAKVLARQTQVVSDMEKTRSEVLSSITDRYVLMRSEGQALQNLLDSASKLQEARQKYTAQAEAKINSGIDFLEKVDAKVQSNIDEANRVKEGLNKIKADVKKDAEEAINGNPKQ